MTIIFVRWTLYKHKILWEFWSHWGHFSDEMTWFGGWRRGEDIVGKEKEGGGLGGGGWDTGSLKMFFTKEVATYHCLWNICQLVKLLFIRYYIDIGVNLWLLSW